MAKFQSDSRSFWYFEILTLTRLKWYEKFLPLKIGWCMKLLEMNLFLNFNYIFMSWIFKDRSASFLVSRMLLSYINLTGVMHILSRQHKKNKTNPTKNHNKSTRQLSCMDWSLFWNHIKNYNIIYLKISQ